MSSAPFFPTRRTGRRGPVAESVAEPVAERNGPRPSRKSVVRVLDAWYIACQSKDLPKHEPIARTMLGIAVVLFRGDDDRPAALIDRCPHRNVPLSLGTVNNGELTCRYHGWRFDCAGTLQAIPGLPAVNESELSMPGRRCLSFPVREQDGYVWVWMQPAVSPTTSPYDFAHTRWDGDLTVRWDSDIDGTLHSTLENILDVPHTSFLHGGLFRTAAKKNEIDVVVRRRRDSVEAQFIGEPRPEGMAGRVLSPSGGEVEHFDRFFLPSVAQVEYQLGSENHLVTTTVCTPITETKTRMFTALSLRTRLPIQLVAPFIAPIAWKILAQDKWILKAQTEVIDRFGTETFSSTPIDLLGPHILHLLKKAEAGALDDAIARDEHYKLLT